MAQYKVPQNVEAEDHIIGPLTFKQFIYAQIGSGWALMIFVIFRSVPAVMILLILPVSTLFLLLAFYRRDGQDFERFLITLVGFVGNPRKRIWRKEEMLNSFKVEPTKVVQEQTQRDPAAVKGELERLATMLDSRGWNHPQEAGQENLLVTPSDRLIEPVNIPDEAQVELKTNVDVLDLENSPQAQNLGTLLQEASDSVKRQALEQMQANIRAAAAASPAPQQAAPTESSAQPDVEPEAAEIGAGTGVAVNPNAIELVAPARQHHPDSLSVETTSTPEPTPQPVPSEATPSGKADASQSATPQPKPSAMTNQTPGDILESKAPTGVGGGRLQQGKAIKLRRNEQ